MADYFDTSSDLAVSVIAPMHNEAGGARALIAEIASAMAGIQHEIIIVDDASSDETREILVAAKTDFPQLRIISHHRNAGQSRAIRTAVQHAKNPLIAMLDGDGQNDPADIPALVKKFRSSENPMLGMVAGERQKRQDTAAKKWASRLANNFRKSLLKDGADDTGCGLKLFRRDAFLALPYFDHMHRYLPALMKRERLDVEFMPVSHRQRVHGKSKYTNFGRLAVAIRDLLGVTWLLARSRDPGEIKEET